MGKQLGPDDLSRVIMLAFGKLEQGGTYWCYVAIKPSRYDDFQRVMAAKNYNIQNFVKDGFGEIVVSGEGDLPPQYITKRVADLFGVPIKSLFADVDPKAEIDKKLKDFKAEE